MSKTVPDEILEVSFRRHGKTLKNLSNRMPYDGRQRQPGKDGLARMKRQVDELQSGKSKIALDLDKKLQSGYNGYVSPEFETEIDTVAVPKTDEQIEDFFQKYVVSRKPCKIDGVPDDISFLQKLKPSKIRDYLPSEEILTIEKKNEGGFGSGARRLKMSFGQFLDKIMEEKDTGLYLTTQYLEDDPNNGDYSTDEEEKDQVLEEDFETGSITFENLHDDFDDLEEEDDEVDKDDEESDDQEEYEIRVKELYQSPMTNLVNVVPETPKFLNYLIPQQINLWIGAAKPLADHSGDDSWLAKFDPNDPKGRLGLGRNVPGGGSSSGLHHDHADNLYVPVAGRKRFTLFAPCDAAKMYTVGDIRQFFPSGVIDYFNNKNAPLWRQLRDDGAIVAEVYKTLLTTSLDDELKNKYEELIDDDLKKQLRSRDVDARELDPPSFSTVPPSVVHLGDIKNEKLRESITKAAGKLWPSFSASHRISVDLKPGEMLYLPTGWFHEVTSYGNNDKSDKNVHVAANYWFIPPTGQSRQRVYLDDYWPNDYKITQRALSALRSQDLE